MTMTPSVRKFALTAHITSSVGWLGAVTGFLALAIAGLTSQDAQMVRGAFFAMELTGWYVIVPLCLASLLTGLIQSLGTRWGLFRYYWVLSKFLMTIVSALILFGFTQTLGSLGNLAADTTMSIDELRNLRQSPVLHSGGGLLVLLVTTTLSVYKPWGMTAYGQRQSSPPTSPQRPTNMRTRVDTSMADVPSHPNSNNDPGVGSNRELIPGTPWRQYVVIGVVVLILLLVVVLHLTGGDLSSLHTPSS